jgi:hypothetical protein
MNSIRIERAQNGFIVCMDDPAVVAKNRKSNGPFLNPEKQFVFDDEASAIAFITKNLDKIVPAKGDDYATSFDAAVEEENDDDEDDA